MVMYYMIPIIWHSFQGKILETVQGSVKVKLLSRVRLFATPWTVAYQAPLSMGFSRQEYWSGVPFPSPGDLSNPGFVSRIAGRHFTIWATLKKRKIKQIAQCLMWQEVKKVLIPPLPWKTTVKSPGIIYLRNGTKKCSRQWEQLLLQRGIPGRLLQPIQWGTGEPFY